MENGSIEIQKEVQGRICGEGGPLGSTDESYRI